MARQRLWCVAVILGILLPGGLAPQVMAAQSPATQPQRTAPADIEFVAETLDNGLRVIYAPLRQAPVVHVRVAYHVGSRDERPDRQGFAHMFEHMMFRGSKHVAPEEHMKLIGIVGGSSNAFTSFDSTQYVNTVPANQLELALYLEADRMASFKVDEEIFQTERKVVGEEWRIRQNQPYGKLYDDFLKLAFKKHPYRWSPIGNMDHLAAAKVEELQAFFNRYYVPNNAVLLITGDIDVPAAKELVCKYFGWMPRGADIERNIPAEPVQTEPVRGEVNYTVPLPLTGVVYRTPGHGSGDDEALSLLSTILGKGESSLLYRRLVAGEAPLCMHVQAAYMTLQDYGGLILGGMPLAGKNVEDVEKAIREVIDDVLANGVTDEQLEKARTQHRVSLIRSRQKADQLAAQMAEEVLMTGRPGRVNTALARLDAVTKQDIQDVARRYMRPDNSVTMTVKPSLLAAVKNLFAGGKAADTQPAEAPASRPAVAQRNIEFPRDYPDAAPVSDSVIQAEFAKGSQMRIDGVRVIVMPDHRLPLVDWRLTMRRGSHCEPAGKQGLGDLVAALMTRGAGGLSYEQFSEDLESRGIDLQVSDHGDYTQLGGSCTTDQVDHAMRRSRDVLLDPALPAAELNKLKAQTVSGLRVAREQPGTVAGNDLRLALFGRGPLGRYSTPDSVTAVTIDDVKEYYKKVYRPDDAFLIISGDVTVERGQELARQLLGGWEGADLPDVEYDLPAGPPARRIILVDRPSGEQSTIRIGIRSYSNGSEERYAGAVASTILSRGIESRLGKYVRAEKGLAYGVRGGFRPGRHAGAFQAGTDTSLETTGEAIKAIFKVLNDMCAADVTAPELREAKSRVAGGMVMGLQTIAQQAGYLASTILNRYPMDYYDMYPSRIAEVTAEQVRAVMKRYVHDDRMTLVVVAPAEKVRKQLEALGQVQVVPMPAQRNGIDLPSLQEIKPAAADKPSPAASQPAKPLKPAA